MNKESQFYLPGLNSLRAIAALSVVTLHIEEVKQENNITDYLHFPFFSNTGGHIGVILFFVLSGFLISLLLLREKKETGTVSIKHFYIRRILRIWPLYFLILFVSAVLLNFHPSNSTLILCLLLLPNLAYAMRIGWEASPQVWSIGVEEQFYLMSPLVIKKVKTEKLIYVFIIFFIVYTLLPHVILHFIKNKNNSEFWMQLISRIYYGTKFNCMTVGAIFALLLFKNYKILKLFRYLPLAVASIVLPLVFWFSGITFGYVTDEVYSILFGCMVLNVSTHPFISQYSELPVLTYLGKISYGIYIYHWVICKLLFDYLKPLFSYGDITGTILLYIFVITASVLISTFSYFYFEIFFLRLRKKFNWS